MVMNATMIDQDILRIPSRGAAKSRWFRRHRWFALMVGAPTVLALLYYGFFASDIYVSQSRFVIKSPAQKAMQTTALASLIQTTGFSSGKDQTEEVLEYLRSRDALKDLDSHLDVRARYSGLGVDLLSRFPQPFHDRSFESFYRFSRSMILPDLDSESGMAVLEVRAFRPNDAYAINARLLVLGESLVNRLNQRAQSRAIDEAERRVASAETRVRNARLALGGYRDRQELLDPTKQATAVLEISNKLVSEQAALQAQLSLLTRVTPRHPAIPALRSRIAAIGQQIASQNSRAVGSSNGIASKLGRFQQLELEQEFGTQSLTAANANLEQARTEAQKQQFYLERVVEPNLPDMPLLPKRLRDILVVFVASLCLYFIGWMLIVGILEHAPEE
jgi:capsular polysaccharide transport system permease protein